MIFEVEGNDGKYIVKDPSNIIQLKLNVRGVKSYKSMVHIITDTIENKEDRKEVAKKILEFIN